MNRNKKCTHPAREFFTYDEINDISICKIDGCDEKVKTVKGNHAGNLTRHIQRHHKTESTQLMKILAENEKVKSSNAIPVYFTPEEISLAFTELTTVNGRPYSLIEDSGMHRIITPIKIAFDKANVSFHLDKDSIKQKGDVYLEDIQQKITSEMHDKPLCFQIDLAKCENRCVLAIVAQFRDNGKLIVRTLAMKPILEKSTGFFIAMTIIDVLNKYKIKLQKAVSFTTDNGTNVILAVKILNAYAQNIMDQYFETDLDDVDMDSFMNDIEASSQIVMGGQDSIAHLRCSPHSMHLAIVEAIQECQSEVFEKCRSVSTKLRTQNMVKLMRKEGVKMAILGVVTRWCSDYAMIERLYELKDFVDSLPHEEYSDCQLDDETWIQVKKVLIVLKPATIKMKILQKEDTTVCDVYAEWMDLICDYGERLQIDPSNKFILCLLRNLKYRFNMVKDCDLVSAAVFIDPRLQCLLQSEEEQQNKKKAIDFLEKIYNMFLKKEIEVSVQNNNDEPTTALERFFRSNTIQPNSILQNRIETVNIREMIESFDNVGRVDSSQNVVEYWNRLKTKKPELHKISQIIFSVASAETTAERNFSTLKFILNRLRTNLSDGELEKILLIKLNSELFY